MKTKPQIIPPSKNKPKQPPLPDIGILAMEQYSPRNCVEHADLENYMGIAPGKFTIGLGQKRMRFAGVNEDVRSMAMTVLKRMVSRDWIRQNLGKLGRLEYGTETLLDKSKSAKTLLIDVLKEIKGNSQFDNLDRLEGITNLNACYGGTAAIINSVNWIREQILIKFDFLFFLESYLSKIFL